MFVWETYKLIINNLKLFMFCLLCTSTLADNLTPMPEKLSNNAVAAIKSEQGWPLAFLWKQVTGDILTFTANCK
ncbi:MAG: hypothetical protein COA74_09680 [Gammaproteobacteria bacterium]|nr:MAG: hypothetical protein COA74_09680 [Gammaproteobacteria bacterium]